MKLVTNKPYDTLFVHYPQLSASGDCTIESPGVWNLLKNPNENSCAFNFNVSSAYKYVLFKVIGGVDYVISCTDSNLEFFLYDYGDLIVDENKNILTQPISSGILNWTSFGLVNIEYSRTLLLAIKPVSYNYIGRSTVVLSEKSLDVELNEHWERDWQNRIDGTCWDVCGKVRQMQSLSEIGKRHLPVYSPCPVLCDGAHYCCIDYLGQQINSVDDFENAFSNGKVVESGVCSNVMPIGSGEKLIRFDFLLYFASDKYKTYYMTNENASAFICESERRFFANGGEFMASFGDGLKKSVIYCVQSGNNQSSTNWFPYTSLYAENVFNIDFSVDFSQIALSRVLHQSGDDLQPTILKTIQIPIASQYCLSFFVKIERFENNLTHYIIQSNQVSIMRYGENDLLIAANPDVTKRFSISELFDGNYHHIGINVSQSCAEVFVDGVFSEWVMCNFSNQANRVALGGNAYISYRNFNCYSRCLTQNELNAISIKTRESWV